MAVIHRPRAPGFWFPKKLPIDRVEIDPTHPLSAGMIMCLLATPYGLVDLRRQRSIVTTPTWQRNPRGISFDGWFISNASTTDLAFTTGPWAVGCFTTVGTVVTGAGNSPQAIGRISYTSESVNDGWSLVMHGDTSRYCFFSFANNGTAFYSLDGTSAIAVGDVFLGGTSNGSNLRRLIVNGKQEASASTNPNPAPDASNSLGTFANTGSFRGCYIAYAWNRDVTLAEWAWLNAEPYAFLRPSMPFLRHQQDQVLHPAAWM